MSSAALLCVRIPYFLSNVATYCKRVDGVGGDVERGIRYEIHQLSYVLYIQQRFVKCLLRCSHCSLTSFSKKALSIIPAQNVKSFAE